MPVEPQIPAAPSPRAGTGTFDLVQGLRKSVHDASLLAPGTAGFAAVWEDGALRSQEYAHLQGISSWDALATCRFIVRRHLQHILVAKSGTGHVEFQREGEGEPSGQTAREAALLARRYIRRPFAAVTFGDRAGQMVGVLMVIYTDDSEPTRAALDGLDRIVASSNHHAVSSDSGAVASPVIRGPKAAVPPVDRELVGRLDRSQGAIGAWEMNTASGQTSWSPIARTLLALPAECAVSMFDLLGRLPNESRECLQVALEDCQRKANEFDETISLPVADGHQYVRVLGRPHVDAHGAVDAVGGVVQKAEQPSPIVERPSSFARQLHDTLDNIPDALCLLDQQWRFTFVNQRCERMIGRTRMDLLGHVIWEAFPQLSRSSLVSAYDDASASHVSRTVEFHLESLSADFEIRVHPGRHGIMLYFQDITERKRKEREIEHLAQHDTLTGLPNRFALEQVLKQQCRHANPWGASFYAALFIDLDGFKHINDTCGHVEADHVLIEVSRRLQETVRNHDLVARYGGDEFVVVLCGLTGDADAAIAEIRQVADKLLEAIAAPIVAGGQTRRVGASLGAAMSRAGEGEPETLIARADAAMYEAKHSKGGKIGVFDSERAESVVA